MILPKPPARSTANLDKASTFDDVERPKSGRENFLARSLSSLGLLVQSLPTTGVLTFSTNLVFLDDLPGCLLHGLGFPSIEFWVEVSTGRPLPSGGLQLPVHKSGLLKDP